MKKKNKKSSNKKISLNSEVVTGVLDVPENKENVFEGQPLEFFLKQVDVLSSCDLCSLAKKYEIPVNYRKTDEMKLKIKNFAKKSCGIDILEEQRYVQCNDGTAVKNVFQGILDDFGVKL